ncbi:FMN-binding negative transcriptional regulator [Porphyrobacter sp. GA68]|uniref:FMN-binding negative transcriptional regulator n=1 Tax=Porphyrobacter sp. GA68 TaxID=2883480 RepID=UPI001D184E51|nr:FMN-binding negative transcriptional regulator [Porphyrobacter sp. GA68]
MHPDPAFRMPDRAVMEALVEEVGFGMIFAGTPDGPRVAHTPLVSTGDGAVQFHLANGNALARHLAGTTALAVVNGPDAYISPRWYTRPGQVPTWNYVAVELEGRVRRMEQEGTEALLAGIGQRHEARIAAGEPWRTDDVAPGYWRQLARGITGFELEIAAWRPTFKLSQNKSLADREQVIAALEANGSPALAALMRAFAP